VLAVHAHRDLARRAAAAEARAPVSEESFSAFVEKRRERAVRMAFRLLGGDAAAAEDAAQNAFVRAYRGLPKFRGESSLDTWFHSILVREVHRQRRWRGLRQLLSLDAESVPEPADPTPARDPLLRKRIAAALERLSAAQRETFVLVHLEGFSITEAASVLGKAPGTLKSHLHRALASLRESLGDLRTAGRAEDGK
jgi:RNA polymerase sigma-70 factor (ECF subfamily)